MIKGVNLGNWLVLEKWMSPELFAGTDAEDETHLCTQLDEVAKRERLKAHRDSYITERDFLYLAKRGIELVRIPVPFFVFEDYGPFVGCISYLDKAFHWAERYQIKVLPELHTVPDSQNGFDNGGLRSLQVAPESRARRVRAERPRATHPALSGQQEFLGDRGPERAGLRRHLGAA
jgi:glucan 1,3-beta-glucosidase